jgi:GntR family transcriptional regulator, rspAB operon transcriptional repressor
MKPSCGRRPEKGDAERDAHGGEAWEHKMRGFSRMMTFQKESLSHKIFKTIRDKIIFMEYPPGMNLSEKDLCKIFKVSRTPLREAIRRLEDMKLVSVIPRYGTYVSQIDINEIRCAFEVKIKLEALAGEVAARRITADKLEELHSLLERATGLPKEDGPRRFIEIDTSFHEIIYQSTQNPILQEILEDLQTRCARLWNSALRESIPIPALIGELKEIWGALKKRDSEKTGQLLENHVRHFVDVIKNRLL